MKKKRKISWKTILGDWGKKNNITEEDLDFMWEACKVYGHDVISHIPSNWREINPYIIPQIPVEYEKMVKKVIYENDERGI